MQITGRLFKVLPAQTGEGKNGPWRRQDIILETDGQYPKKIVIGASRVYISQLSQRVQQYEH